MITFSPTPSISKYPEIIDNYSPEDRERKQKLSDHRHQLDIDFNYYVSLVNQIFWENNPSLKGRTLSNSADD